MAPKQNKRLHGLVALVLVVGLVATVIGFDYSRSAAQRNDAVLLRQEAGQGSVVLASFINQINQSLSTVGPSVVAGASSQPAFLAAASSVSSQSTDGAAVVLIKVSDGSASVVASVGNAPHAGLATALLQLPKEKSSSLSAPQVVGVVNNGRLGIVEQDVEAPYVPTGYALYWEIATSPVIQLQSIKGIPFSGVQAALYFGSEKASNLVFATTKDLPLRGQRAVIPVSNGAGLSFPTPTISNSGKPASVPGQLFMIMTPTAHLSGEAAAYYPWILLIVGVLASVVVAVILQVALRRRDEALGLVGELKETNAELDLAMKRQAEAEEHLRQAQHLEAVGQLAGGIAHDFNNLLHVILSYTAFLERGVPPDSPLRPDLLEVRGAAQRAAELTRQLLVFARREMVRPESLEANSVVRSTELLLKHTLGEAIELRIQTAGAPCYFLGDLGECKQILVNLAINARDAMPKGGILRIQVRRADLRADEALRLGVEPGAFVRIDASDTGTGMVPEVAARAFEPFFTTKDTGKGTGLGLAMIYGIASRWHGATTISTAPGEGTTVSLYLPMAADEAAVPAGSPEEPMQADTPMVDDAKVVLLVEDQEQVRRSTARILQSAGYAVLEAVDANEAERVSNSANFDLLLTDVVMPGGRSGKDLADHIHRQRPDVPVVFVTGYGSDAMAERGILPSNVKLVEKPFEADDLLRTLEEVLSDAFPAR